MKVGHCDVRFFEILWRLAMFISTALRGFYISVERCECFRLLLGIVAISSDISLLCTHVTQVEENSFAWISHC